MPSAVVNPGVPVPPDITRITGITQAEVDAKGLTESGAVQWLGLMYGFADLDAPLWVGHNALRFDLPFVRALIERAHGEALSVAMALTHDRVIDTAALYKGWKLGMAPQPREPHHEYAAHVMDQRVYGLRFNLAHCCADLGVDVADLTAHRAAGDVVMTHRMLSALLPKLDATHPAA